MSQSEFTPLYNKLKNDTKKAVYDFNSFKYLIYREIYTSDFIRGLNSFEKYIYKQINLIPRNTIYHTFYLIIRVIFITFINLMGVLIPLLISIAIIGYFKYSPSWLGRTTRYILSSILETPYHLQYRNE
jgi:hypothetical protein